MTDSSELMSIGELSSLARISVRMLRHYDAHGVLIPAVVVVATVAEPFAESIPRAHEEIAAFLGERGLFASRTEGDVTTHQFNVYVDDLRTVPEEEVRVAVYLPVR